jgi:LAGLIDADG endonuclease
VAADGTFGMYKRGGKYKNYGCAFRISQDEIDEVLLKLISQFLGCGKISKSKRGMCNLGIFSISNLNTIIIPFFFKYRLNTSKEIDFHYFCEIVDIFNKKGHNKK